MRPCGIDGGAVATLAAALCRLPDLQRLVLDNDPCPDPDPVYDHVNDLSDGSAVLAPALRALADLRSLQLAGCMLDALASALGELTRLTLLSLARNDIGNAGAAALAPELAKLAELRDLRLDGNHIGDAGAAALAAALPGMTRLKTVHLNNNMLGGAGLVALAAGAARHGSMEELHVLEWQAGETPSPRLAGRTRQLMPSKSLTKSPERAWMHDRRPSAFM